MYHLYLIRHAESQANTDPTVYYDNYDHEIGLTENGKGQAKTCGGHMKELLGWSAEHGMTPHPYGLFVSSYARAIQTWEIIQESVHQPLQRVVDVRLREQEYKDFKSHDEYLEKRKRANERGKLYYRYKQGESANDVIDRVTGWYNQLRQDWILGNRPERIVVVSHEITMRCILHILQDLTPEQHYRNFGNCEIVELTADKNLSFRAERGIAGGEVRQWPDSGKTQNA